mmetsp:Transcript_19081/g.43407  ORF Transcript_19081/g.43407 Transcript_19081/m.43407 type:complete len:214 (-) Transcript_19081:401-1042(-)
MTPTTTSNSGSTTTRWCKELAAIRHPASVRWAPGRTTRGAKALCRPRSQCPTGTSKRTCSANARRASRGVTTPAAPGPLEAGSVMSTQFWCVCSMARKACSMVAVPEQVGSAARGFMTSATVAEPILRCTSCTSMPPLQRARARSKEERMLRKAPLASSLTRRCRQAPSPRAWHLIFSAASQSGEDAEMVISGANAPGKRARPPLSQTAAVIM